MNRARRVQQVRARARIQRWEARQRNLAHGAWFRFRLALAHAEDAYAIDEATAQQLVAEGMALDPSGTGLEPPRTLVWITAERARQLSATRLALRLDAAMLAARYLALVPFFSEAVAASPAIARPRVVTATVSAASSQANTAGAAAGGGAW